MKGVFETRIAKLEQYRKPVRQWLYHVSNPPTADEQAAIAAATGPIIICPHLCETVAEWEAKHTPKGVLQ